MLLCFKSYYQAWLVDSIIKIKPFRLVFACITDSDNQGKVPSGSIIDRDNQASLSLIITDNQAFFTTRRNRNSFQFPSFKIGTKPTGPADPGNGHYEDPTRDFEGAPFLCDLIGDRDSETNQIEEHAHTRPGQRSEVNLAPHSLADMVSIVVKKHSYKPSLHGHHGQGRWDVPWQDSRYQKRLLQHFRQPRPLGPRLGLRWVK